MEQLAAGVTALALPSAQATNTYIDLADAALLFGLST